MNDDEYGNNEGSADDRGRQLAQQAIDALALAAFIRSWNAGEPGTSYIVSVEHLHNALSFDDAICNQYNRLLCQAKSEYCEIDFLIWLSVFVTPSISASFVHGLLAMGQAWARAALKRGPAAFAAPTPFPDTEALINWLLATAERPPISGPTGEPILDADAEDQLLRQALRAEIARAPRGDWLRRPSDRRSVRSRDRGRAGTHGGRS